MRLVRSLRHWHSVKLGVTCVSMTNARPSSRSIEDLDALQDAISESTPPSHAFGRAATTGASPADKAQDLAQLETQLESLEVSMVHMHAFRSTEPPVVSVEDLRGLTKAELTTLGLEEGEVARVLVWLSSQCS